MGNAYLSLPVDSFRSVYLDPADVGTALEILGATVVLIGTVVTGVGLYFGWRRALERNAAEARARAQSAGALEVRAFASGTGTVTAIVTALGGSGSDDEPVTREQLRAAIESMHREIQKVTLQMHTIRADAETQPRVTDQDVDAAAARHLASHEQREGATALHDLGWALVGLVTTAVGGAVSIVGLFLGWC